MQLVPLAVAISMAALLASVAMQTDFASFVYLLRRPSLLVRSAIAMNLVMPLFAVTLGLVFEFEHPVQIALVAMALSPVPPFLPGRQLKAGGTRSYVMGLLFISALASIVFVPAAATWLEYLFDTHLDVSRAAVARLVATWMLFPLLLGSAIHALSPRWAARIAGPLALSANATVLVALVLLLLRVWPQMLALLGHFTLVVILVFVAVGLAVGHLMGGPDPHDRTVLALSTASRHPAVALVMLHATADREAASAAVLLVLLLGAIASTPYARWRARRQATAAAPERVD